MSVVPHVSRRPVLAPSRPLLKWAGGKRQLLPRLRAYYPASFERYIEPFLGSGAVFFDLAAGGHLADRRTWLLDVNPDLIGCYRTLRDDPEAVIDALSHLAAAHARQGNRHYYEVRDERFNPARAAGSAYTPELAAMLIYLNRTGFNGLFRVNREGGFNVPVGRYVNPRICDREHLLDVSRALGTPGVHLELGGFETALDQAGPGDFVYCDPPYAPLSPTASFAHYTAGGFSAADQARLQRAVIGACQRGASVVLSNSSAPDVRALYSAPAAQRAGLRVERAPARRAINSRATLRGPVDELIVSNVTARLEVRPRMLPARLRRPAGARSA
ncbi:MAG: Dam family site-specific DNA-(adenine-N6)-methyltransferase [Acidimicrobiia bacterium]|nr:Dam family site-specific DNA-(adenine-N6)-methyltransferase [Acidimicrobiia bacterium]